MLFLDAILRFPAVTLLVLIALLALRDARHLIQGRIAVILCLTLAAMLLTTAPEPVRPPDPAMFALRVFDTANIVFLWWFGLSLFQDDFKLTRLHWGGLAAYLIVGIPMRISYLMGAEGWPVAPDAFIRALSIAMIVHLFWTALSGWRDDLIEARRRTRLWFTVVTALAASLITGGEIMYSLQAGHRSDPDWLSTSRVIMALPAIVYGTYWFLFLRSESLLFEATKRVEPKPPQIDVRDHTTHERLIASMEVEHLYREQGLSIGELAQKLNVPEHQLRALINKGLGYRNFAAFLNQYRLAEAKAALADPEQARTPILTIAMDVGYASLATFNRAFKTEEGVTPSTFRSDALSNASQS